MARLGIFVDGAYLDRLATGNFNKRVDFTLLPSVLTELISAQTAEPLELMRTYYYDALPFASNNPRPEESQRQMAKARFFSTLRMLPKFQVREGWVAYRGQDASGHPIFQQKQVDVLLGLDIALLSAKKLITHMALVAGDSDLAPAIEAAKNEGVVVWLFHGGDADGSTQPSVARSLLEVADMRQEIDREFMDRVARRR